MGAQTLHMLEQLRAEAAYTQGIHGSDGEGPEKRGQKHLQAKNHTGDY